MRALNMVLVGEIIGPRLESGRIVIETVTSTGRTGAHALGRVDGEHAARPGGGIARRCPKPALVSLAGHRRPEGKSNALERTWLHGPGRRSTAA